MYIHIHNEKKRKSIAQKTGKHEKTVLKKKKNPMKCTTVSQYAVNLFLEPMRNVRQWMSENRWHDCGTASVLCIYTVIVNNDNRNPSFF